jgi:anaerobic ribonucleoside-triphosphate reductase activating protein
VKIEINRMHYPVKVLGFGARVGIWVQGCSIRCPGCSARDTWDVDSSRAVDTDTVVELCSMMASGPVDGVTISGGEPFDQSEALHELLGQLRVWLGALSDEADVLCYSGRSIEYLANLHPETMALLDCVVAGPFHAGVPTEHPLLGSGNQQVVPLTELGRERYGDYHGPRGFQVSAGHDSMLMIGIPRPGDLERLAEASAAVGVDFLETTWRM